MVLAAEKNSVQLTFNHQRRFGKPFSMAKDLLKSGQIGDLLRLEAACGDIYDYGTHYIDMFGFYNQDLPAKWVQGQIDYRTKNLVFGAMVENQATALWEYQNGVFGFIATGLGSRSVGVHNRLVGTEGVIEVGTDNVHLRIQRNGKSWETIDTQGEHLHGPGWVAEFSTATDIAPVDHAPAREPWTGDAGCWQCTTRGYGRPSVATIEPSPGVTVSQPHSFF